MSITTTIKALALATTLMLAACSDPTPSTIPQGIIAAPTSEIDVAATGTPEPTIEVTPEPMETPEPTPTPPTVVPKGTIARAGDWDVKVNGKVNFNAWKAVKKENMFNEAAPKGWKMVMVPLLVTNRGEAPANILGSTGYVVGDATGVERTDFDDPTCGVIPKELDAFTTVRVGGTLKGNMCFVVEDGDIKTLRMGWPQGMFSDEPDIEFALR